MDVNGKQRAPPKDKVGKFVERQSQYRGSRARMKMHTHTRAAVKSCMLVVLLCMGWSLMMYSISKCMQLSPLQNVWLFSWWWLPTSRQHHLSDGHSWWWRANGKNCACLLLIRWMHHFSLTRMTCTRVFILVSQSLCGAVSYVCVLVLIIMRLQLCHAMHVAISKCLHFIIDSRWDVAIRCLYRIAQTPLSENN